MENKPNIPTEPAQPQKAKKPIFKKWWFWLIIVVIVFIIIGLLSGGGSETGTEKNTENTYQSDVTEADEPETKDDDDTEIPAEYKSALIKAQTYSDNMHMSKQGIYDQLTSDYGEQFSEEAAQYAVDNVDADWKQNALEKAKTYQETMAMSPEAIRDQLTSEYGEKFTQEEADFAVENLNK